MVQISVIYVYWFNIFQLVSNFSNASNGINTKYNPAIFRAYSLFKKKKHF